MILTDEEILRAIPGLQDCLSDPWDKFETGDDYGSIPYDMIRLGRAVEAMVVNRQLKEMNDLKATISLLLVTGPRMARATNAAGDVKYGTMLDVLNDYRMAAEAEAREVDRLNTVLAEYQLIYFREQSSFKDS